MAAYNEEEAVRQAKEKEKRLANGHKVWITVLQAIIVRRQLQEQYGGGEDEDYSNGNQVHGEVEGEVKDEQIESPGMQAVKEEI